METCMINQNGKKYDASILKIVMDDRIHDMLDFLTKTYMHGNNRHTVVALILEKYAQTIHRQQLATKELNESLPEVTPDAK